MGNINLNLGCSLEAMREMQDNQYDLAIVDPPYGINIASDFHKNGEGNCRGWGTYDNKKWDSSVPNREYFEHLERVSKNQIIWGGNYFTDKLSKPSMGWIVWNKVQRNFTLADGELAYTSFDRALRIFDYARGSALSENKSTEGMWHPTKKPVALYRWLLDNYAQEGDKILDTHLGSGSIALACYDGGFSLDGWEIDPDYHSRAVARFEKHSRQLRLFGGDDG